MDRKSFILLLLFTVSMFFINNWLFDSSKTKPQTTTTQAPVALMAAPTYKNEKLFVIENEYQQLVFSNVGGALKEINLPFKSESNAKSLIYPIEIDQQLATKNNPNAQFPLSNFIIANSNGLQSPKQGGYYPLLRRGIKESDDKYLKNVSAEFYGLALLSDENKGLSEAVYEMSSLTKDSITFQTSSFGKKITKKYQFAKDQNGYIPYSILLNISVDGEVRDLLVSTGVPEAEIISSAPSPELKYLYQKKKKLVVEKLKLPKSVKMISDIQPLWVANSNGFFGIIVNPLNQETNALETSVVSGSVDPSRLSIESKNYKDFPGYSIKIPLRASSKNVDFRIFAGPFDNNLLTSVDASFAAVTPDNNPNFSEAISYHGWFSFISEPFAKFLLVVMQFFYSFTHSWVFALFMLTVVLKVILFPLTNWSTKSMAKMQELNPKVEAIKKRYPQDPQRANLEIIQLYKENNYNPLSMFLPIFIQFPFLIGMLDLLRSSFPLRGVSFIPGWIDNLTAPDVLFSWGYSIPFIGNQFHLLPFILGGLMFLQTKLASILNPNKNATAESIKQGRTVNIVTTSVFTVLFYNFPSGLNIYWIFSTLLGILQQYLTSSRCTLFKKK